MLHQLAHLEEKEHLHANKLNGWGWDLDADDHHYHAASASRFRVRSALPFALASAFRAACRALPAALLAIFAKAPTLVPGFTRDFGNYRISQGGALFIVSGKHLYQMGGFFPRVLTSSCEGPGRPTLPVGHGPGP